MAIVNDTTLKDLMDRALAYADFPKDSLDADQKKQLINDINDGLIELWEVLTDEHNNIIHKVAPTTTLVAGTEAYNLPDDFYKAIKVFYNASDRRYRVRRFNIDEIDGFPKPLTAGSIELWYAPVFRRLKIKGQNVPTIIPTGWENYAALFAAVRLLTAEATDFSQVAAERDRLMQRIIQHIGDRDEQPDTISDFYNRFDVRSDLREYGYVRQLRYRIMGSQIYFIEIQLGGV